LDSVRDLGLDLRVGLHTGECELVDGKVAGIAVHTGSRVASQAHAGEVLVSSTVKDLVAGSGIAFEDRGTAELKGIPGEWGTAQLALAWRRPNLDAMVCKSTDRPPSLPRRYPRNFARLKAEDQGE